MRALVLIALVFSVVGCQSVRVSSPAKDFFGGDFTEASSDQIAQARRPASGPHLDSSGYFYDPTDTSCDGYPRLKVETAPGMCLGLVMPKERAVDPSANRAFSMPRTMVQIPGTQNFLVVDMGSWHPGRGALFLMSRGASGAYELKALKTGMDFPHAVKIGPDGKYWISELKQISRFEVSNEAIVNWQPMVTSLPMFADDSHPLAQFTFDPRNHDLYINAGAPSDHCLTKDGSAPSCPEIHGTVLSGLLKISWASLQSPPATSWVSVARGLRNSMAMTISTSGLLIQGENARDFSSTEEPYEEMNVVDLNATTGTAPVQGVYYGWPYCYDFRATSPEWVGKYDCSMSHEASGVNDYQEPFILMPPHAAPLSAGYYNGSMFPALKGQLLMAWHGYRPTGHRLVAYPVDAQGRPVLGHNSAHATYSYDRKGDGCVTKKPMDPDGGFVRYAPYTELITRWNARLGLRPRGAPSSFTIAEDGSIWITEDKNQVVVRLSRDKVKFAAESCDPNADDRTENLAWRSAVRGDAGLMADYKEMNSKLIQKYCASCHDGGVDKTLADDEMSGLDFVIKSAWFVPKNAAKSNALQAIMHAGTTPAMPLPGSPQFIGTPEGDELTKLVQKWVDELPTDVDSRVTKLTLKSSRKIRSAAALSGTVCGLFPAGVSAYVDPRASTYVKADGQTWIRAYIPPDSKFLTAKACPWPMDGVFYLAK